VTGVPRLYAEGEMQGGFACVGQTVGRIDEVLPVAEIIRRTLEEFGAVIGRLSNAHLQTRSS